MNHDGPIRPAGGTERLREHLSRMTTQLARTEALLRAMDALPQDDWAARRDAFLDELARIGRSPGRR